MERTDHLYQNNLDVPRGIFEDPRTRYIALMVIGLLLSVLQVLLGPLIGIAKVTPDFVLIFCVRMAIIEGQIIGMSAGFVMGFVYDIVSGDILGTNALAKTVASFGAGYFHNVNLTRSTLTSLRFVMIVVLCSIAHNFLYFFFYIKPLETSFLAFFLQYGLGTSAYTAIFALVPILMRPRRG